MRYLSILISALVLLSFSAAEAQPFDTDAAKQGLKGNVKWVKRTWYKPVKKGSAWEADKSSIPEIYLRPNQLISYNETGRMQSTMDYKPGTNEESGATHRYYYQDGNLTKEVLESSNYAVIFSTEYAYNPAGHRVKSTTTRGPGDQLGITQNEQTEFMCDAAGCVQKEVRRNKDGALQSQVSYTWDAKGQKTGENYYPAGLYSAKKFTYDNAGRLLSESSLDKDGEVSYVVANTYDAAGNKVKTTATQFYDGKKQSESITGWTFNAQGDRVEERVENAGKKSVYSWQHTYDAKGNRIQTVHLKDGVATEVEVLEITYGK